MTRAVRRRISLGARLGRPVSDWWHDPRWIWFDHGRPSSGKVLAVIGAVNIGNAPSIYVTCEDGLLWSTNKVVSLLGTINAMDQV